MGSYVRLRNKKLIVTADDFGLTQGVNEAIVLAHRQGIVTSASLMVNGMAFESAASLARQHAGLDVGLHLNLTQGHPVSDPGTIPSLASSRGFLYDHPLALAVGLIRRRVRAIDLEREIQAQLERALGVGLEITHVDGHKHVHVIPNVLQVLCKVAPAYGIKALRSVVERAPGLRSLLLRNRQARRLLLKQYLFGKTASAIWKLWWPVRASPAFVVPERFYGITQTGFLDFDAFTRVVHDLQSGVNELMCHPGYVDDGLNRTPTRLRSQRERELELLTTRKVRDLIDQSGIELISYRHLVEDYGSCDTGPVFRRYSPL